MTDEELQAISSKWDEYPTVGTMPDGTPIKNLGTPEKQSLHVREPSGYFCSPIAYSVRLDDNASARRWFTPKWANA